MMNEISTLTSSLTNYLSHLSSTDVVAVSGTATVAVQYFLNKVLNLAERRFVKAFLAYLVTPGVMTVVGAILAEKPHFLVQYPWVVVAGQIIYYVTEKIIVSNQPTPATLTQDAVANPPVATGF